jgi:hypothetical protein
VLVVAIRPVLTEHRIFSSVIVVRIVGGRGFPPQEPIIEPRCQFRLDNLKIGRNIEVPGHEQTVVNL